VEVGLAEVGIVDVAGKFAGACGIVLTVELAGGVAGVTADLLMGVATDTGLTIAAGAGGVAGFVVTAFAGTGVAGFAGGFVAGVAGVVVLGCCAGGVAVWAQVPIMGTSKRAQRPKAAIHVLFKVIFQNCMRSISPSVNVQKSVGYVI
jgi:hypothetical protein